MTVSDNAKQHRDAAARATRSQVVVPIQRSGVLARQFCQRIALANVEAVFERCFYLRSGGDFICIGEPDIGNGPITLIGNLEALPTLKSLARQMASICREHITVGNSVRFTLDASKLWRPFGWPIYPSPERLIGICAVLASRAVVEAQEGLARCVVDGSAASRSHPPLARLARPRIVVFERWLSARLTDEHTPAVSPHDAVHGLIGLGPGLTPSGDDFLIGALSALDAIGESKAHVAMARAIVDMPSGSTTPLSARFLRVAAAGHVGENLHQAVSSLMTGDVDGAIAAAGKIGHSSGWDMLAGILITLRIAGRQRLTPSCIRRGRMRDQIIA